MAVVVLTVEVTLPETPPAVSSGKSAILRLPLSIINGGVLQTHAAELPRGRACPVCSQLNRAGQRGGSGSSVPRPAVCVRASSHTSSNNGKKEVSTTTTQKAMQGPSERQENHETGEIATTKNTHVTAETNLK